MLFCKEETFEIYIYSEYSLAEIFLFAEKKFDYLVPYRLIWNCFIDLSISSVKTFKWIKWPNCACVCFFLFFFLSFFHQQHDLYLFFCLLLFSFNVVSVLYCIVMPPAPNTSSDSIIKCLLVILDCCSNFCLIGFQHITSYNNTAYRSLIFFCICDLKYWEMFVQLFVCSVFDFESFLFEDFFFVCFEIKYQLKFKLMKGIYSVCFFLLFFFLVAISFVTQIFWVALMRLNSFFFVLTMVIQLMLLPFFTWQILYVDFCLFIYIYLFIFFFL